MKMSVQRIVNVGKLDIGLDGAVILSDQDLALIEHVNFDGATAGAGTNSGDCGGLVPNLSCNNTGTCTGWNPAGCINSGRCT